MTRAVPGDARHGNSGQAARGDVAVRSIGGIAAGLVLAALAGASAGETQRAAGVEFFEKKIRPVLVEHCYQCHGEKKQESSLALNSAAGIRRGGDRGAVILEGDAEHSLLIRAVRYADDDLKMPPRGKLKDEQIADLAAWIAAGAVVPREENGAIVVRPSNEFDLAERSRHWAYQAVQGQWPVVSGQWSADEARNAIDAHVLAKLFENGLKQSPEVPRRTLIRRVTFDLTGLPPTPGEVTDFLRDETPDAYERLVDRLLASPRHGERFGRHWLDVVRYSETLGFEFDYDLHHAWRYRDYVIRAFNADLPFDQFVIEHLAGDLVPEPRRHPIDDTNESILATGFWWMHEGKQTPVDIRQDQADRIDNQLDVLGKAFLGQTIACARCHDHKFDAISTRDYYALAGYLRSSRYQQAFLDQPESLTANVAELQRRREAIGRENSGPIAGGWIKRLEGVGRYLSTAVMAKELAKDDAKIQEIARQHGLEAERLQKWIKALADESLSTPDHPLAALAPFVKPEGLVEHAEIRNTLTLTLSQRERERSLGGHSLWRFDDGLAGWFVTGDAFENSTARPGQIVVGSDSQRPVARLTVGGADSGAVALRLQGELRSPTFTIDKKFVHVLVAGRGGKVNFVIDGYTLIMNPMYGKLTVGPASNRLTWRTIPVDRWVGQRAFIEVVDSTIPMHGLNPPPSSARVPETADGYVVIKEAVLSDDPQPPVVASLIGEGVAARGVDRDVASIARAYEEEMVAAARRWRDGKWNSLGQRDDDVGLINWLLENGLLDGGGETGSAIDRDEAMAKQLAEYRDVETTLPKPNRAPAMADGTGEDEFVFLRGNWRTPGERAVRRAPEVLRLSNVSVSASAERGVRNAELPRGGRKSPPYGSGRLELAEQLVSGANPLLPRVIVNRLWQHHFGEGLVRTPDDFGRMGQVPSHPELLDWLAGELVRGDWSLKAMTRKMVTSGTYRQRSQISDLGLGIGDLAAASQNPKSEIPNPQSVDPENRLLWRMPVRRLEAEGVRDSILAVSGRLDDRMQGPSVLPHITSHMEGRGKPQSGPLDGEGRRSVYLNARRNFLTPMLLAFDYPVTFTPIGRRGTSAIPAQALTLMNDPLVVSEAKRWAERTLADRSTSLELRIEGLFQTAFARPPTADELASAIDFLQEQSLKHGGGSDDARVWTDLCHVLMNVKEFIFVE